MDEKEIGEPGAARRDLAGALGDSARLQWRAALKAFNSVLSGIKLFCEFYYLRICICFIRFEFFLNRLQFEAQCFYLNWRYKRLIAHLGSLELQYCSNVELSSSREASPDERKG
jgi:hypothetical protein